MLRHQIYSSTHFIVAWPPRRRPHSEKLERSGTFLRSECFILKYSLDKALALLRRYGTSKFWMLYPVRISGSTVLRKSLHCTAGQGTYMHAVVGIQRMSEKGYAPSMLERQFLGTTTTTIADHLKVTTLCH